MMQNLFKTLPNEILYKIEDYLDSEAKNAFYFVTKEMYQRFRLRKRPQPLLENYLSSNHKIPAIQEGMRAELEERKKQKVDKVNKWLPFGLGALGVLLFIAGIVSIACGLPRLGITFIVCVFLGGLIASSFFFGSFFQQQPINFFQESIENTFKPQETQINQAFDYGLEELTLQERYALRKGEKIILSNEKSEETPAQPGPLEKLSQSPDSFLRAKPLMTVPGPLVSPFSLTKVL